MNPSWTVDYFKFLKQFTTNEESTQVILTTHHPLAIAELNKEQVQIMWKDENQKIFSSEPIQDPRGMGYSGILTSDLFGLTTTLDNYTEDLLREQKSYLEKEELSREEQLQLTELNNKLANLGFSMHSTDTEYAKYMQIRKRLYPEIFKDNLVLTPELRELRKSKAEEIIKLILKDELEQKQDIFDI